MDVYTLVKIDDLIEKSEIELESSDTKNKRLSVKLPYDTASHTIEIEGSNDDELIDSFKEQVNHCLDQMIDHLNDCKLD